MFPSCRYTTGTGSEEWGWTTGGKKLARHLLVQILRKELWGLRTKHKEGRKTAKQLVFSEIEISNLNLGYLSPSELYRQLCIGQPLPSPCFSNNCYLFLFVDLICDHGLVTNDVRLISRGCSVIGRIMQTWIPNHAHNGGHSIWGLQWLLVSGCGYACILSCKCPCTLLHFSISFHCLVMNWILSLTHSTSTRVFPRMLHQQQQLGQLMAVFCLTSRISVAVRNKH